MIRAISTVFLLFAAPLANAAAGAQALTPLHVSVLGNETKTFSVRFLDAAGQPSANESVQFVNDACGWFPNGNRIAPAPSIDHGDMWWGGTAQDGWGIALLQQYRTLFGVWFTYDADGAPTWLVMPSGYWSDATTYEGHIYRTTGSPWSAARYDATAFHSLGRQPF